jgi:hypothetical protein
MQVNARSKHPRKHKKWLISWPIEWHVRFFTKNHEFPEPYGAPLEIQLNGGGLIENGSFIVKVEGNKELRHHNYDPGTK